jgi:hypothetical protein
MRSKCEHGNIVCSLCYKGASDAAKRLADNVNARIVFTPFDQLTRSWMAFKLEDGSTDGTLYDSREDAISHQVDEKLCAYICMRQCLQGISYRDADLFLKMHRMVYDAGGRFSDITQDVIMSNRGYDILMGRINPYE